MEATQAPSRWEAAIYDGNWNSDAADFVLWEKIWQSKLHERLKIFVWRVLADVIPTRDKLNMHFDVGESSCCLCGAKIENVLHLFKECPCFRALAFSSKIDLWSYSTVQELVDSCLYPPATVCIGVMDRNLVMFFVVCLMFSCWKMRNESLFRGKVSILEVASLLNHSVDDFVPGPCVKLAILG